MNDYIIQNGKLSAKKYGITKDHLETYIALLKGQYRDLTAKEALSVSPPKLREDLLDSIVELETLLNS